MKRTAKTNATNAQDDLEILFQEMFGRKLNSIQETTIGKLEENNQQFEDWCKKLNKNIGDVKESVDDFLDDFDKQNRFLDDFDKQNRNTTNLVDRKLNIIGEKLSDTKVELESMIGSLNDLNEVSLHSKEEMVRLIVSLSEPMAKIDHLELEQKRLAKSLGVIECVLEEIKLNLNSLGERIKVDNEKSLKGMQLSVSDAKDEIIVNLTQFSRELEEMSIIGFDALRNELSVGLEANQKLVEDGKNQTSALIEGHYRSFAQRNHEQYFEVDKQLKQFANYGKVLIGVNAISLIAIFALIYFHLY